MGIRQSPVCSGGIDLAPEGIESCRVESIRTSRPVGPRGQVLFDLVAKVQATSTVVDAETGMVASSLRQRDLIGRESEIRQAVSKGTSNETARSPTTVSTSVDVLESRKR